MRGASAATLCAIVCCVCLLRQATFAELPIDRDTPIELGNMSSPDRFVQLVEIGAGFFNIRSPFRVLFGLVNIGTHMSVCRLTSGKYVVIDTVQLTPEQKAELNILTDNGKQIEAVLATHPYHTSFFAEFHEMYPEAKYYGTPRHRRTIPQIPWTGDLSDQSTRSLFEPEIAMRIPDGTDINSEGHFTNVFVYHRASNTVHNDDTILNWKGGFLSRAIGMPYGIGFHPDLKNGLVPGEEAPGKFKASIQAMIDDWKFENLCTAHNSNIKGNACGLVQQLLNSTTKTFDYLAQQRRG